MGMIYEMLYRDPANAGTLYDSDESHPRPTSLIISNFQAVKTRRDATKYTQGELPPGTLIAAGQLLARIDPRVAPATTWQWFLVSGALNTSTVLLSGSPVRVQMLPLPLLLTFQRYTTGQHPTALNWNSEPWATTSTGTPATALLTTFQVRAGMSNDFDPLTMQAEGQEPGGITTLYVPLGSGVKKDDAVTLPDGRVTRVQRVDTLDAEGAAYALQLVVNLDG